MPHSDSLDALARAETDVGRLYGPDALAAWRSVVDGCVAAVDEGDDPRHQRVARAVCLAADAARQARHGMHAPALALAFDLLSEHLAGWWRLELAVASAPVPDTIAAMQDPPAPPSSAW